YGDGREVVRDVTLEFAPGEQVALVGATGAGKSTVAKLLTRQYDPQHGSIDLGGVDLRDATLESLHRRIVLLPQEGHLFSGTIAHRLSTAERADRVAVLEQGRVVEVASHDELVEQGERYARLWASWQAGLAATA